MESLKVGVDDGHAVIKLAWMDGGEIRTLAVKAEAKSGEATRSLTGVPLNAYETEGQILTVVESGGTRDTRTQDYPVSNLNRVFIHHALVKAGFGGREVEIVTGLPVSSYFSKGGAGVNQPLLDAKTKSLALPVRSMSGDATPTIRSKMVLAEGVAAVFDLMMKPDGTVLESVEGSWSVIDIGGRTTDIVTVSNAGGTLTIDQEATDGKEIGCLTVKDIAAASIADSYGCEVKDIGGLDRLLETRRYKLSGREHDAGDHVAEAVKRIGSDLLEFVTQKIGRGTRMDRVLLVGGGAQLFRSELSKIQGLTMAEDPQFANARGMLKVALNAE